MSILSRIWCIIRMIGLRFYSDRLTYSASALTYTTLLALVPFLTVCMTVLSAFPFFKDIGTDLQQFILQNFIPSSGQIIQNYVVIFIQQAGKLPLIGTAFLVATAISMMLTIERAINDIWKVHHQRQGIYAVLVYWAMLSLAPVFIGLSIAATSYLISVPFIADVTAKFAFGKLLVGNTHVMITFLVLMFLYVGVPNCKVRWRYGFVGAFIATILFEATKKLFVIYVTLSTTYQHIYGALAVIPIFLLWVYLLWIYVLLGALISNVLSKRFYGEETEGLDGFSHALLWIEKLFKAQQQGEGLSVNDLYQQVSVDYQVDPHNMLLILEQQQLIRKINVNEYMLSRDLSSFTLNDLHQLLPWKLPAQVNENLPRLIVDLLKKANQNIYENLNVPLANLI